VPAELEIMIFTEAALKRKIPLWSRTFAVFDYPRHYVGANLCQKGQAFIET
jgi:hypothetical protein